MKVAIVGLGLIGGSLALDLKASGIAETIVGVESNSEHARKAMELNLVDKIETLDSAVSTADLVILAVHVNSILKLLPEILSKISNTTTVMDMGSTKVLICKSVEKHPKRAQYVSAHPMAGTENSGPSAAFRGLFKGKTTVICDTETSGKEHIERVENLFVQLKMRVVHMSSTEHDVHVSYVSHLPHVLSFILANTVLEKEKNVNTIFDLAGGGFESTVRLAKSSSAMWGEIFEQNHVNIADALDDYIKQMQNFRQALTDKDRFKVRQVMEDANRIRRILESIDTRKKV